MGTKKMPDKDSSEKHDEEYYEVVKSDSLADRAMSIARKNIYEDFKRYCNPNELDTILDVGVSDVIQGSDNMIERLHPFPNKITAAGLGGGGDFKENFPDVTYVQVSSGANLPFRDNAFSIVTSNAVLEHVGSIDIQKQFVKEMLRVGERVFLTVPNRYFPVEHHTAFPILAWSNPTFHFACRIFKKVKWANQDNLILMSRSSLRSVLPSQSQWDVGYTGIKMGQLSSNLFAYYCQK